MTVSECRVNVIIPNWNGMKWLPGCLEALASQDFKDFAVTLIDNGSNDGSVDWLTETYPDIQIIQFPENRGFAVAVNEGINQTHAEYVVLLNTDTVPRRGWLGALVAAMDAAEARVGGLASKMLLFGNEELIENSGDILSWYGETIKQGHGQAASGFTDEAEVFSICAGAALYRRSCLESVGLFDNNFFAYLEDVDWGLRARIRGFKFRYIPSAEILHHGHAAGLKQVAYVRLVARNRLLLFLRNAPTRLIGRHLPQLIYGQWYFLLVYRHPIAYLRGVVEALILWPRARRTCRALWQQAKVTPDELDKLLRNTSDMTPIRRALIQKFRKSGT
jgi:GT2 family glycosyltransferase